MAAATVSPPSPESNTPIGLLSALCDTLVPFDQRFRKVFQKRVFAFVELERFVLFAHPAFDGFDE